jgi:uncharacterized repeat protein (TIGR03803 family)
MLLLVMGVAPAPLHSQTYTDLHNFSCATDGCLPLEAGILAQGQDGNLYGTVYAGGTSNSGTVFKFTPAGTITILYNFSGPDGSYPFSGLTLGADGNFYGTAYSGGASGFGTIFKITPAGVLTTLHSFTGSDGMNPYAPPVLGKDGSYYGVTSMVGPAYSISSSGTFKLLTTPIPGHSFAPLILASDGNFYGTTQDGGTVNDGTVFRMSANGTVTIVYSFDGAHGRSPYGPVVQSKDGFLYGTTYAGGSFAGAVGVVFKLSTGGAITVLHEFDSHSTTDGVDPVAGLVAATDGNFYGATDANQFSSAPYGTLFKITKSGTYSVLYVFDLTHGARQFATATQHTDGILYGLPGLGGSAGVGVFYSLAVGIPPFVSLMPTSGTTGQTIQVLGKGLTGTTSVKFGTGSAKFTIVSDTYLTAVVPASGSTGHVTVTTPSGPLISSQTFKVIPVIKTFTPTSGRVGAKVTIAGSGFVGAKKVTFGGVKVTSYKVASGTKITATVPTGAKTGKIGVTTAGGSTNSKTTFTVTP